MLKQCGKEEDTIRDILEYEYGVDFDNNIYKPAEINMDMLKKITEISKKQNVII